MIRRAGPPRGGGHHMSSGPGLAHQAGGRAGPGRAGQGKTSDLMYRTRTVLRVDLASRDPDASDFCF